MPNTPTNDPDRDEIDDDLSIPGFDEAVQRIRAQLKPGGPEVDRELLTQFAAKTLPDQISDEVRQKTRTWLQWDQEYWRIRSEMALSESKQDGN